MRLRLPIKESLLPRTQQTVFSSVRNPFSFLLSEVPLQQALEGFAVPRFTAEKSVSRFADAYDFGSAAGGLEGVWRRSGFLPTITHINVVGVLSDVARVFIRTRCLKSTPACKVGPVMRVSARRGIIGRGDIVTAVNLIQLVFVQLRAFCILHCDSPFR